MGMNPSGSPNQAVSGINVTPLIDVLLVLLIIFMVIVPVTPHGLDALLPQPPRDTNNPPPPATIVVQVLGDAATPTYKINDQPIQRTSLQARLAEIYATRLEKIMFVQGAATVDYARIADVIDIGHEAGVQDIGLITPRTLSQ